MSVCHIPAAPESGHKGASDPLELKLQMVVSCLVGSENLTQVLWKSRVVLTAEPSLQSQPEGRLTHTGHSPWSGHLPSSLSLPQLQLPDLLLPAPGGGLASKTTLRVASPSVAVTATVATAGDPRY